MTTTCIRRASWVIGWDSDRYRHVYLRNADVAFDDTGILHVGGPFGGPAATEIDGRERFVFPGLVNVHCHPSAQAIFRGYTEEFGNPRLFFSGRHRFRQSFEPDVEGMRASARFTIAELLAGGVTTIVDLSHPYDGWLEIIVETAVRAVVAPMFRSARWYTDTGQETQFEWFDDEGRSAFEEANEIMDAADRHPSGLLSSMVSPAQVDTCTEALLRDSIDLAARSKRPLHVHAAQSYAEFQGMTRRHDMTPIQYLRTIGFLGPRTVIGHAVFTDEHPWLHWPRRDDLRALSRTNTTVAHAPTVFARDGTLLHDLGSYAEAGVHLAIGTDTHPHNMLEELRVAEVLARVAAGPRHRFDTARVFTAATVGGADAIGRQDLGRLAVGARADIIVADLEHPSMEPTRDPLRSIVYAGADRPITHVFVNGRLVVDRGAVVTVDRSAAAAALRRAQQRAERDAPSLDPDGVAVSTFAPLTLEVVELPE